MANLILTSEGRLSFPHLVEPNTNGKYAVQVLLPKDSVKTKEFIARLRQEALQTCIDFVGEAKAGELLKGQTFLRDGDNPATFKTFYDSYSGHFVLNASRKASFGEPVCVNLYKQVIPAEELYAGCNVIVSVSPYTYSHPTAGKGVALGFTHVMKTGDNTKFGGSRSVEEVFAEVEIDPSMLAGTFLDSVTPAAPSAPAPVVPAVPVKPQTAVSNPAPVADPFSVF